MSGLVPLLKGAALGVAGLAFCLVATPAATLVSPADGAEPAATDRAAEPRWSVVEPDIYLLPDKGGQLQRVLGFGYEAFVEAYKHAKQIGTTPEPPQYSLQRFEIEGSVEGRRATLRVEVHVLPHSEELVRIPLGLGNLLVTIPAEWSGEGEHFLDFDAATGQYVAWLRGKRMQQEQLRLDGVVPVVSWRNAVALKLSVPRSVSSRLVLQVPLAAAVAQVSPGATLTKAEPEAEGTRLTITGLASDFQVSWRGAEDTSGDVPPVLDVSGMISSRLGRPVIHTEAGLTVRSLAGPMDRFRIVLPPAAKLLAVGNPDVTVVPVDAAGSGEADRAPVRIEIRLPQPTVGPVEVPLVVEQPFAESPAAVEISGFEVEGAVRQTGHVAVQTVGDWRVRWTAQQGALRMENAPKSVGRDEWDAVFEYFQQPFLLRGDVRPRTTVIQLTQDTLVRVGSEEANLEARFSYHIAGKKVSVLEIETRGWDVDLQRIQPAALFDVEFANVDPASVLTLPLRRPLAGDCQLVLFARRGLPADAAALKLPLPTPHAIRPTASTLGVIPDENVELMPQDESMVGLRQDGSGRAGDFPRRPSTPLWYRVDGDQPVFAAVRRARTGIGAADVTSPVEPRAGDAPAGKDPQLVAAGAAADLPLVLVRTHQGDDRPIFERLWIQTLMTPTAREDRLVFKVRTRTRRLELTLPPGVMADTVQILSEGRKLASPVVDRERLLIRLPQALPGAACQLEIRYVLAGRNRLLGRVKLTPPRFAGSAWFQHVYWQIALPSHTHLVRIAEPYWREYEWQRSAFGLARQPVLSQRELEDWSGGIRGTPVPAMANTYLVSGLGSFEAITFWAADRSGLVLAASGTVLVFGLTLIYISAARRPGILLTATVVLAAAGLRYPDAALLLGQAAVLGVAFASLAALLKISLRRRRPPQLPQAPGSSSVTSVRGAEPLPVGSSGSTSGSTTVLVGPAGDARD